MSDHDLHSFQGAKSFLRSNHALAALALAYSIHVDVVPSFKNLDPESVAVKKGLGDCFEAYVGALEYNQDNREAEKWLVDVFEFITEIIWSTAEKKVQLEQGVGTFRADLNLLPKSTSCELNVKYIELTLQANSYHAW